MKRAATSFFVPYPAVFKQRLLLWLHAHPCCAFYDSHQYKHDPFSSHDCIGGCADALMELGNSPFASVDAARAEGKHLFGFFGYDLKNKIERLHSDKPNRTGFPDACFFAADTLVEMKGNSVRINGDSAHRVFEAISNIGLVESNGAAFALKPEHRTSKKKYLQTVNALRGHIEAGDFYEFNYCQEFFCNDADVDPLALFERLS